MTDIAITAANVLPTGNATLETGIAGATITAGQVIYKEAATGAFKLTDTDSATAEAKNAYGIALNGASAGQPLTVVKSGPVTIGGTLVAGVFYYASNTPGGICPAADVATEQSVVVGYATSTSVLNVRIVNTGVTVA